jgi:LuxR family maltose regulon positive regulatory protein
MLQYLAQGLSNQAIADLLVLGVGTIKTHLHHLYGKLAARDRTHAVARARQLGLLR